MDFKTFLKYAVETEHGFITELIEQIKPEELDLQIAEDVTIRDRLQHMSKAEFAMASMLIPIEGSFAGKFETLDEIKSSFERSKEQHLKLLDQLQAEELEKVYVSKNTGKEYSWKFLLYHFLEHLSTHRGQIAMKLREHRNRSN